MAMHEWDVYIVNEVRVWIEGLDDATHRRVVQAIDALAEVGPGLGRPLVDTITGSRLPNLKELRPGTVRTCSRSPRGDRAFCLSLETRQVGGRLGTTKLSLSRSTATRSM
ncbi:type II toxin-antitoxin system RelE/ParE family toxin [Kribbella sp. VKM Ac-2571]|uniref:type II toxin-antitoxin system RelE/ParE family toxin n=1 Tax=Kribbella sp. VKM Ac-2571 TaxID=2512222 RepID=UPI00192DAADB